MRILIALLAGGSLFGQAVRVPANERIRVPALDHPLVLVLRATDKLDGGVSDKTRRIETPVSTTEDAPYALELLETWRSPRPDIARDHYEARLVRVADGAVLTQWHLGQPAGAEELESVAFLISEHFERKAETFTRYSGNSSERTWRPRHGSATGWSFGPTGWRRERGDYRRSGRTGRR
jgi:hypothetical protein